jgi:Heparinase II/III-like protein/Heparinase II/III N-terminus
VRGQQLAWYVDRARGMSATELAARSRDQLDRWLWVRHRVRPEGPPPPLPPLVSRPAPELPLDARASIPAAAASELVATADHLLAGHVISLGVPRADLRDPDWFHDPVTGRRAPKDRYAFRIRYRSERETGNVKQVWELSRHHHLTALAAAYYVTQDERYADIVRSQLESWWRENPFLSGVHWTSGIEIGLRLIAWTWIRRLLAGWPGVKSLFDENPGALRQIHWHQRYLARFRSVGSSANNHVIAEAAGQLVAACGLPWFEESDRWRVDAAALLEAELRRNTFATGINRELASEYHAFVAMLGLVAAVECDAARAPLHERTWHLLCAMVDAAAATVDERLRPPRQGDGDDARVLVTDGEAEGWSSFLAVGGGLFTSLPWWPAVPGTVVSTLLAALANGPRTFEDRPATRPSHFTDAGMTVLRTSAREEPPGNEIWCRCDAGPHGYLSIAAHAHADALSVELRCGGIDVLADPGTYCYHGEAPWRSYFRSTLAHNTVEIANRDQSRAGGPFLWVRSAVSTVDRVVTTDDGEVVSWSAHHDGYQDLDPPATHRRTVELDRRRRRLEILDQIESLGAHGIRMTFHLGPAVEVDLEGPVAQLQWASSPGPRRATFHLPDALRWSAHHGELDPILGWYSPRFGLREPTTTLVGIGSCSDATRHLRSVLEVAS